MYLKNIENEDDQNRIKLKIETADGFSVAKQNCM